MSKKDEEVYSIIVEKYKELNLPKSFVEFRKLFPNHTKFDKDSFLIDLAGTINQELSDRLNFLLHRLYHGDMVLINNERNFLREKIGTERLFKLYVEIRTMQLSLLNALDNIKLGGDDKILLQTLSNALNFLREVLYKEFVEISKIIIDGWKNKIQEKREAEKPSYIR
jgi:hypothetical protein